MTNCPFDVVPYDQSRRIKSPNLVNVNFTNQDFWSMRDRLKVYIKEKFADDYNDLIESDLAIMLINNWAFIADTLSFKIDQIANEIFIDTVSEVDNAFRLALLTGFKPKPPIAARSLWSATINSQLVTDLAISTPLSVDINTESGPKKIELFAADPNNEPRFDDDIIIAAGSFLNTSIVGLEGITRNDQFSGNGEINQFKQLAYGPVIYDSIRVQVDGVNWTEVDYFTDSQPRREFRVEFDSSYNAYILFGNNRAGMIPSPSSTISVTYRVGGGVAGNIVTGSVEFHSNIIVPGFDFRIPVTFRNYTRGEFGYDGDTIDDIKRNLPVYLRAQDRAVTGDDYEGIANNFSTAYSGSVGKATAVLRNYGCAANIINIYILAKDGSYGLQEAGNELKTALKNHLNTMKMITDEVCIKDGTILEVDVSVDVILDKFYRKFEDEFRERINRKINSFFSLNNWNYGQSLKAVDILKEISEIKEIRSTEMTFQTDSEDNSGMLVVAKYYEIIRPQNITTNFVYQ
jgi:hypothetical protein